MDRLEQLQAEIDRLNSQLVQWSKANLAVVKKLSETERENRQLKAELAIVKADLETRQAMEYEGHVT